MAFAAVLYSVIKSDKGRQSSASFLGMSFMMLRLCVMDMQPLLANDVTLVPSYGYCQSLKLNAIRGMSVLRFVRLRVGYTVGFWEGLCHRNTETGHLH